MGVADPLAAIDVIRAAGFVAQPNHVLFGHAGGSPIRAVTRIRAATPTPAATRTPAGTRTRR